MEIQSQIERNAEEENPNESKFNPISPLSPTSSPNHEFSFTISLHPQSKVQDKNKANPSSTVDDLSPADKIFFHGHLLPLHYLSNLSVFPRSSTDSFDGFTLPIKELFGENNSRFTTYADQEYISIDHTNPTCQESCSSVLQEKGIPMRPRSFSFFGISKWRKGCDEKHDKGSRENDRKQKRKTIFNLSDVLKRYMRLINPFFLSLRKRRMNPQSHGQIYSSFSGNLRVRKKKEPRGRRGGFSAPASTRNSPTNSGLLVASGTATPTARDGSMEELQAAIQSAIAHCKKSIAAEETIHVK